MTPVVQVILSLIAGGGLTILVTLPWIIKKSRADARASELDNVRKAVTEWQKIADEAAKQCGRTEIPEVFSIRGLEEWLRQLELGEGDLLLFCYENEEQQNLKACLRASDAKRVILLIGPEGGFSLEEAEMVFSKGAKSVTLGPRILRAETAAIAAMSMVQYELGDI